MGIISVLVLPFTINAVLAFALIMLYWFTERNSLNFVIENNRFLS